MGTLRHDSNDYQKQKGGQSIYRSDCPKAKSEISITWMDMQSVYSRYVSRQVCHTSVCSVVTQRMSQRKRSRLTSFFDFSASFGQKCTKTLLGSNESKAICNHFISFFYGKNSIKLTLFSFLSLFPMTLSLTDLINHF